MKTKPELLCPAGSLEKQKYAFAYGADAVYAGAPQFSLRARENAFSEKDLIEGVSHAHRQNKKFYLTANIFAHNRKIKPFMNKIASMLEAKPDALIMADIGLIDLVKQKYPETQIHLSVQANAMSWAAVKTWKKIGVSRVILSREISIEEIKEIRDNVPEIELEAFVHGAVCVAHSGRCLISNFFNYRDANDGCCTNACRWEYNLFLEESKRPGEMMPIEEDEHGTYILNAKDLMAIEHIQALEEAGVDSLKIEGRNKSIYYLAMATRAYRKAIDDNFLGEPFDVSLIENLNKIHNRGYTAGFLVNRADQCHQRYEEGLTNIYTQEFSATVIKQKQGALLIAPRNKLCVGDEVEVVTPLSSYHTKIESMIDEEGLSVAAIHGGTDIKAWIPFDHGDVPEYSLVSKVLSP